MAKMIEYIGTEEEERIPDLDLVMRDIMSRMDDIMALMELLSIMKRSGIIDLLKAVMENRNSVTEVMVDEASKRANMNFIRNALSVYTFLSGIDPDLMRNFMKNAAESISSVKISKPSEGMGIMKLYSLMKQPGTLDAIRIMLKILSGLVPEERKP